MWSNDRVPSAFDLHAALVRLATRNPGRSEADIQSDVRDVLLYGGFDLDDQHVSLETPTANRHRLDVSVGGLIVECKRDLRRPAAVAAGAVQLGGYLASAPARGTRYNGVLTDGARWLLYRHTPTGPHLVDEVALSPATIDTQRFRWWLGALLSTESGIQPTASNIEQRLGADASSFHIQRAALLDLWALARGNTAVTVKRDLWGKLLRSAFGSQFTDADELFVEHTYLVIMANAIAHAVIGFDLRAAGVSPGVMLSGRRFEEAGFVGVGEAGFFDWPLEIAGGDDVVADITRKAAVFDWVNVDHDVLKALYQSVIAPDVRHRMGEYYTPDWLATLMVDELVDEPLDQRILDPSCGSGTFLFHAIRRHLDAAEHAGIPTAEAVNNVTSMVFGVDLHPVAVSLAQVTYLLGIGTTRLAQRSARLNIPVYLGDSMRWDNADDSMLASSGEVVIHTTDGNSLFGDVLRFPARVVSNPRFEQIVDHLSDRATQRPRGGSRPAVRGALRNMGVDETDLATLEDTYTVLCDLHDQDRDHIWGFYVRNQARPAWLTQANNRVDRIVGNPPWLAYRFMPAGMQETFTRLSKDRQLWAGGARGRTTQQDLSGFFVARSIEQYLVGGGRFAFVVPRAALSRKTYGGFRAGDWTSTTEQTLIQFDDAWDLLDTQPQPFPVPGAVVFGRRVPSVELGGKPPAGARSLPETVRRFAGPVDTLTVTTATVQQIGDEAHRSPYAARFRQGAILIPRMLTLVVDRSSNPLGAAQGMRTVESRKTSRDNKPWIQLAAHTGVVETTFIRPAYLGESIAPFRVLDHLEAVVPHDGNQLMGGDTERIDRYPGLAAWWRGAEAIWMANRSSDKRTLIEQIDYIRQLTAQFPIASHRVVYTKAGTTLAAAVINDDLGIIDHKLYWAPVTSVEEGQYLCAILNSPGLSHRVKPFQSVGAFGTRDFDKYVWMLPIPIYDSADSRHQHLVELAAQAKRVAATTARTGKGFQADRKAIRRDLVENGVAARLDAAVTELLGS
jgi:hypothetical protein